MFPRKTHFGSVSRRFNYSYFLIFRFNFIFRFENEFNLVSNFQPIIIISLKYSKITKFTFLTLNLLAKYWTLIFIN